MDSWNFGAMLRVAALTLIAVAIWFLCKYDNGMPAPKGLDAPKTEFSAARADVALARILGPEIPHPISSVENANVRGRIQQEFAALGVKTSIFTKIGCEKLPQYGIFACGTAKDIIAEVRPGPGKAVVMLAHYDSVPAGPGASDDGSGVASILESVRALKARPIASKHPILAVITDGEEAGLVGAAAFLRDPMMKARVGAVVNVEARGNQGPSIFFQTSPGDGPLVDLYVKSVHSYMAGSIIPVVYSFLPNDTDLTNFLREGFIGFNFAFVGRVAHYHTPLDNRADLSLSTLQQQGENMLGMTAALANTDFATLQNRHDAAFLTVFGKWVPRIPVGLTIWLALLSFAMLLGAGYLSRTGLNSIGQWAAAFAIPPAVILGSAAAGWVLHSVAVLLSGQPDPSYAYPDVIRIAFAFAVLSIAVLCSRMAQPRLAALAIWFWMSVFAIITAATFPGASPYFLFPTLISGVLLLAQSRAAGAWTGATGEIAILLCAIAALVIWLTLAVFAELVQGLQLAPLFMIPTAIGAMTLIPLVSSRRLSRDGWLGWFAGTGIAAVVLAVIASFRPAFSEIAPQRLNITFVDDHVAGKAKWAAETAAPLPGSLRSAAGFSQDRERPYPMSFGLAYLADAGNTRYTPPSATLVITPDGNGRRVALTLHGSDQTSRMVIVVPKKAMLNWAAIDGIRFQPAAKADDPYGTVIECVSNDCRHQTVTLDFGSMAPVNLVLAEQRYALPADGVKLTRARPKTAVASQNGDTTVIFKKLTVR